MSSEKFEERMKRASDALRSGYQDLEWLRNHPEVRREYAGQWIVLFEGRVVAHSQNGESLSQTASMRQFPGSSIHYIPTAEELAAVKIV